MSVLLLAVDRLTPAVARGRPTAIWGFVADRYDNKRILMVIGLVALLGATLVLWLAGSVPVLLLGRVLQGASAGLTWTVSLAIVVDSVSPARIGFATGWIEWSTCVGTSIGPLLGGLVFDKHGYDAVFEMCLVLVAVDSALRLLILDGKEGRSPTFTTKASSIWSEPGAVATTQLAGGNGAEADEQGRNTDVAPFMRKKRVFSAGRCIHLFRKPRFLAALWGSMVAASLYSAFDSTLALFVSSTFRWDATGAGLMFLPLVVPACLAPVVGAAGDRVGAKWLATAGFLVATPLLVCLRFVQENVVQHKILLAGLLTGIGLCLTFVMAPLMAEVAWSTKLEADEPGMVPITLAYSLYNMAFSGGAVAGPLLAGCMRNIALGGGGLGGVGSVFAIVSFATAVTQAVWVGGELVIGFPGR